MEKTQNEKNKLLSRTVPTENTEMKPAGEKNDMIEYYVEGPKCIDNQGNPYIKDVQLKESWKHHEGKINHTKGVYLNTGKLKNKYKYYAPKLF